ncbi:alpha/beta hydrolase [Agrococcus sp. SGAir0287]|uniref:alpha/beta hydrolase n=1 Tax=Agrococcus sp. SGAir0287 TaxID=2070347 RepID=UPI0010CD44CC|nr:alpha/beta hydrolase [Agrococcus sp. SGAir0287]QCR20501.1 alpha/beta hydrolase [Agrococcus sp. SGAir0287]
MDDAWREDVLGDGFHQRTLPLRPDDEGEVVATLVRALPSRRRLWHPERALEDVDVLYVHGWSDYFFQTRLARSFTDRGARFFALDLRKYGRSIRPGQTLGFVADLGTYDEDIAAALAVMREDGAGRGRRLVLLGHSTGGLTLTLWAHRHPGVASAVILNAPWLELQFGARSRAAITPVAELRGRLSPLAPAPQIDLGFYARAQREVFDDEDPYVVDHAWRPEIAMTAHAGWIRAVLAGHAQVAAGLAIEVPVLVLLSTRSILPTRWSEALTGADTVIAVDPVARAALHLGRSVTIERIDGALHDVFLSRRAARTDAYARLERWLDGMLARR